MMSARGGEGVSGTGTGEWKREEGGELTISRVGRLVRVRGRRGHAAADGLQQQREEVAGDEDARVPARGDARVGGAEGEHDAREGEVDAGGEEGGGDGQADDLDEEAVLWRWEGGSAGWGGYWRVDVDMVLVEYLLFLYVPR